MKTGRLKLKCIGLNEDGKGIVDINGRHEYISNLLENEVAVVEVIEKRFIMESVEVVNCNTCQMKHRIDLSNHLLKILWVHMGVLIRYLL